jgi:hypothetical protein
VNAIDKCGWTDGLGRGDERDQPIELAVAIVLIYAAEEFGDELRQFFASGRLTPGGPVDFLFSVRLLNVVNGRVTCTRGLLPVLRPHLSPRWPETTTDRDRYLLAALVLVAADAWREAYRENVPHVFEDPEWLDALVRDAVAGVNRAEPELKLLRN